MPKIVARMMKLKAENLKGIEVHNQRETDKHSNKDIDTSKSYLNYDLVNQKKINYKKEIEEYIQKNRTSKRAVRKDAVLVDEWILTSSSDFFADLSSADSKKFFQSCLTYFEERCGKNNIKYATVHLDETTPHMHLGIVPMADGRLNHKLLFDRQSLIDIQEELPKHLKNQGFNIERGIKDKERKHLTVPEYKEMQQEMQMSKDAILINDSIWNAKSKEIDETKAVITELSLQNEILKREQKDLVQSLQETVFPDLENIKEKRFSINGQKYILSDEDLKTIKSIASDLKALKMENKRLRTQFGMSDFQKTELENKNFENKQKISSLETELESKNQQIEVLTAKNFNYEHSEQLSNTIKQQNFEIKDLKSENLKISDSLEKAIHEKLDYKQKYLDLKEKFDGLTMYLHDKTAHTKDWILKAISEGVKYMKNKPKINQFLDYYNTDKPLYISKNGVLYAEQEKHGTQVVYNLDTQFTLVKPALFNTETGMYELTGTYKLQGFERSNTFYLSEEDILNNKQFTVAKSLDSKAWNNSQSKQKNYIQGQEWSR